MNGINIQAGVSLPVAKPCMADVIDALSRRDRFWVDATPAHPVAIHPPAELVATAPAGAEAAAARATQRFPVQILKSVE
ncbi:hypothetical protein QSJ19_20205 [Gordonia sp. ABSL11-1]|uniref:hypothetical protein n=1 Tax=Gordonia sp. ABSL11-1 TaxID=3053924 RepID=UPI00257315BB|nr:hypothetical protein [Gordonia sp. ABSL11-1]MDL9947859.1 hypothetical protein [Gordonia sp. ABSL11-1]